MKENKKIAIIIPAYKADKFLKECLDSIELQTYFKTNQGYEILLGVDACQETLAEVKRIRNNYRNLRVFMMETNKGPFVTLNTLISITKADNIIIFDADDIMKEQMIEKIAKHMDEYDIIRYYCQKFFKKEEDTNDIQLKHGSVFFKKQVFDKLGGFKPWICGADTDFLYRAESMFRVKHVIEVLYGYRVHAGSLTQDAKTGKNSEIRMAYLNQISKKFEHIETETNLFFEVN